MADTTVCPPSTMLDLDDIRDAFYPVNTIVMTDGDSPAARVGGEWAHYAEGKFPAGASTTESSFAPVGRTGGQSMIDLKSSDLPAHSNPSSQRIVQESKSVGSLYLVKSGSTAETSIKLALSNSLPSGLTKTKIENRPPFIITNYWKRIA